MPGINLTEFATGADQLKPAETGVYTKPKPDTYEYTIEKIGIYTNDKDGPNKGSKSIYIDYRLGNGQQFREYFGLPRVYGQETDKERQALQRYLRRLVDLGVPAETVNSFTDTDSMAGWTGVFTIIETVSGGKPYLNLRSIRPSQGAGDATQAQLAGQPPRVDAAMIPAPQAPAQQVSVGGAVASPSENPFG